MKSKLTLLFVILSQFSIAQNGPYSKRKIANWLIEYFPNNYFTKPHHVVTQKKFGKLVFYQEVDQYGNPNGIKVEMQNDFIHPYSISYFFKGNMVYSSSFFPNSNVANSISNWNLKNELNGPNIFRDFKKNNAVSEKKIFYKNGNDINQKEPKIQFNNNGFLTGTFIIDQNDPRMIVGVQRIYSGSAKDGYVNYLEVKGKDGSFSSYTIDGFCCIKKEVINGSDTTYLTGRIENRFRIYDQRRTLPNYKDVFGLEYWTISGMEELSRKLSPFEPRGDKTRYIFKNNQLSGKFESRYFCDVDFSGLAKNGELEYAEIYFLDNSLTIKITRQLDKLVIEKVKTLGEASDRIELVILKDVTMIGVNDQLKSDSQIVIGEDFYILELIYQMTGRKEEIEKFLEN